MNTLLKHLACTVNTAIGCEFISDVALVLISKRVGFWLLPGGKEEYSFVVLMYGETEAVWFRFGIW
jgi:hypothetical protein